MTLVFLKTNKYKTVRRKNIKKFDYNEYNNLAKSLDQYFASAGYDCEKVWDIHEELSEIYEQMLEGEEVIEETALKTIDSFVELCIVIKDAFYYPISLQECLQALILIGMYPVEEYEIIESVAYDAAHIFHTHINHPGE